MRVRVVRIGDVRMGVMLRLMGVAMAVRAVGHRMMNMVMMTVVVRVGVFVRQRLVLMRMLVRLG